MRYTLLEVYCFEAYYSHIVLLFFFFCLYLIFLIFIQAHFIKDRRCNTTRAVFALESSYKWALSGTPLQNRVGELYSLVNILHIKLILLFFLFHFWLLLIVFYRFVSYKYLHILITCVKTVIVECLIIGKVICFCRIEFLVFAHYT